MILYLGHVGLNLVEPRQKRIEVKNGIPVTRWDSGISLFHPKTLNPAVSDDTVGLSDIGHYTVLLKSPSSTLIHFTWPHLTL